MSEHHQQVTRRSVVRTAAWAVPAITVVSAAPAYAASGDTWSVLSTSWEGGPLGARGQTSTYYMRFTITAPAATTLTSITAVAAFGLNEQGDQINAPYTTGSLNSGWSRNPSSPVLVAPTWTYTRGATSGQITLELTYNSLLFMGSGSIGTFTFSSPGQPDVIFTILKENAGPAPQYITSPPA